MEEQFRSLWKRIIDLLDDWTARRIVVLLILAVVSEYILTDLQTPSLSIEGMKQMVESSGYTAGSVVPGLLEGSLWFEADHVIDLVLSLGILISISAALILVGKKHHIRLLFILFNLFLLIWIIYNVVLMVASLWSQQGVALMHLFDAALIWFFCIFTFGIFTWVIDAELQQAYTSDPRVAINYLFPQTLARLKGWECWTPSLLDYIFLSFTISTSFGPTDTQVLSQKAKLLLMIQASISLVIILAVAAWAISNI